MTAQRNHLRDRPLARPSSSPSSSPSTGSFTGSFTGQLCPVAAALDSLGDTWSILVLRDLLWHGTQTVEQLTERTPALDVVEALVRLDHLAEAGLVERSVQPVRTSFRLTPEGRRIGPVIESLLHFGEPIAHRRPVTEAMIGQIVRSAAVDRTAAIDRLDRVGVVALEISGRCVSVLFAPGELEVLSDESAAQSGTPDAVAICTQDVFGELLCGAVSVSAAHRHGELEVRGCRDAVSTLFELLGRG